MKKTFLISTILLFTYISSIQSGKYRLLIGTYTNTGKSEGIYSYEVDFKKDGFIQKTITKNVSNPSFLAFSPDKKYIYSVSETDKGSAVKSFSFDKKTAQLIPINTSLTKSNGPCHIVATQKNVFTANYGGGSISVFGRNNDGSITDVLQLIRHSGSSINTERQKEPHVHQIILSKDKKYIVANDLGTDNVTVYKYSPENKNEILVPFDTLQVKLGSGPRHATFNKKGNFLYLVQEIDGTVSVLGFNKGQLSLVQETTLVKTENIINRAADIHL